MCDTMAAVQTATADAAVLFAKNSDREFAEAQYLQLLPAASHARGAGVKLTYLEIEQAPRTHAVLLSKPHWMWGAEIGANEHGLVIGNQAVFAKIPPSAAPGIIGMDYLRLALERALDVEEAVEVITTLLREHGQSGNCGFQSEMSYHNSFILADSRGAKVLETVEREWVLQSIDRYEAISNALMIEETPDAASATLERRAIEGGFYASGAPFVFKSVYEDGSTIRSGTYRRGRARELLKARDGRLRPADLFAILRDHQEGKPSLGPHGPRICAHIREHPLGQTTASWVSSITPNRTVHWVTGTAAPCTGLFKPILMEVGLPAHGTRPGAHEDSTSLWWRHEQIRRYLEECEREVRDGFIAERDALEGRFVQEMTECGSIVDVSSRDAAQRMILRCWSDAMAFESQWFERSRATRIERQGSVPRRRGKGHSPRA
jgi:secernin